jgi:hypothetical protein
MQQLGYHQPEKYAIYWLLPGMTMDIGLRHVDTDTDTLSMIAVVPKFHFFQLYVDHKDIHIPHTVTIDDVVICGSPELPPVLSPRAAGRSNAGSSSDPARQQQHQNTGHELRRSRRKLGVEEEAHAAEQAHESEDSEFDEDWVDSDNEVAADDDDLYEEWVDEKFEEKKKNKSKWVDDSDYDTENDFEDLQDSDIEDVESADEVEVTDKYGRKTIKKKVRMKRWRPENMKQVEFHIGMVFVSVKELRTAIQEYIVQQRVQIHYIKNDLQRVRAACMGEPKCQWYLYAAPDSRKEAWTVKKYEKGHNCERDWKLKQFTARYLAGKYLEKFKADDKMSIKNFARLIEQDFNMSASRSKLERARRIALKQIHGDELAQYSLLWDFAAEVRRSNPGSTMFVNARLGLFENCYMSLDACKRGFMAGCRPIIGIDGCHIKNRFGGVMLVAVGVDPNHCIFPISIGIVEVEDTQSWKWFLSTLKEDLGIENTRPWTFMSDRQKVIFICAFGILI